MNKLLFTGILVMIVMIVSICVIHIFDNGRYEDVKIVDNIYSGPVPLGYDLKHYRETGETIKLEDNNGS